MTLTTELGPVETRDLLKALSQFDKELAKTTRKRIRRSARIITNEAKRAIPSQPPMSGWRMEPPKNGITRGGMGWPAWWGSGTKFATRIGKTTRLRAGGSRWDLVRITAKGAAATIYGYAREGQTTTGQQFVQNLNRAGQAPRAVWPAVDRNIDKVERDIMDAVNDAAAQMNKRIG